jgi:uncharacterized membrane protein YeaQ/YmgE (transglycosylase-associated protein family)
MVITINGQAINLDLDTILIWSLVGLVAGFLASHIALGHGLGLFGDIIVGIIGAFIGGVVLAGMLHFNVGIAGHPIISEMIMAFIGAAILLLIVRLLGGGRRGYSSRRAF